MFLRPCARLIWVMSPSEANSSYVFFKELDQPCEMTGLLTPEVQAAEDAQFTGYSDAQEQDGILMSYEEFSPSDSQPESSNCLHVAPERRTKSMCRLGLYCLAVAADRLTSSRPSCSKFFIVSFSRVFSAGMLNHGYKVP